MTDSTNTSTIDWNEYWRQSDDVGRDDANASADHVLDAILELLASKEAPDSYVDVGCGGGAVVFEVAERYPETTVIGYDSSRSVIAENRERVRDAGVENLTFEVAELPAFDSDSTYDLVSCFFTLCYVADVERALSKLYEAVAPGGDLVITYHNRLARSVFEDIASSPHDHLDETTVWHPERFADRFELVLEGENLLSYERIHDTLGTWPRSLWSITEAAERYDAWRQNPLVYVPK